MSDDLNAAELLKQVGIHMRMYDINAHDNVYCIVHLRMYGGAIMYSTLKNV